jgi:hypothetical protein
MANKGHFLVAGQSLAAGDYLTSPNGQYIAFMQDDGNFVLYWGRFPDQMIGAMWATGTSGTGYWLSMQTDGNLVLYKAAGQSVWTSGTQGRSGPMFVRFADDGNLLLCQGTPDQPGSWNCFWETGTAKLTFWIKNKGAYVARAWLSEGGDTGGIDEPQCKTLSQPISRTATLSFGISGAEKNSFKDVHLGALRAQRYLFTGSLFHTDAEPQAGYGTF